MVEKGRAPGAGRGVRWSRECGREERLALYRTVRVLVEEVEAAHQRGAVRLTGGDRARATLLLDRILGWTPDRLEAESERFRTVYRHVGILPPDQYLAVLLQATEGCAWNRCTFCTFYRNQPFRVKTPDEFLAHVEAVRALLGEGVHLRRSVFLGDANAIAVPQPRLLAFMELARGGFPEHREIHAFMDVFTVKKGVEEFRLLRTRGLRRVVIGLETGCDELLAFVRKPGSADAAVGIVRNLKAAGIGVGIVVLLGLGGARWFDEHVGGTVRAINAMGLDGGDIVYFSPLVEFPETEYAAQLDAHGLSRPGPGEMEAQEALIRRGLRFSGSPPTLARYDIREFLY